MKNEQEIPRHKERDIERERIEFSAIAVFCSIFGCAILVIFALILNLI